MKFSRIQLAFSIYGFDILTQSTWDAMYSRKKNVSVLKYKCLILFTKNYIVFSWNLNQISIGSNLEMV